MRIPVGILGATGLVGRRLLARLADHPWFEVIEAGASDRSVGRPIGELLKVGRRERREDGSGPATAGETLAGELRALDGRWKAPLLLSALPARIARELEPRLAAAGHLVVSNASAHRMDPRVPLIVPEINPDHLALLEGRAGIVTNPNCSVATFIPVLAALHRRFGIDGVTVTTFQAVSGAGSRGPTTFELLDNLIPVIPGEEEKLEGEPVKILGELREGEVVPAPLVLSATTTRVPVLHGHLVDLSLRLRAPVSPEEAREALSTFSGPDSLPSLPPRPLRVVEEEDRPQPRLDRAHDGGMRISVGRIRRCPVHHLRMMALAHNLERGAAGAAVVNAELCRVRGLIPGVGREG